MSHRLHSSKLESLGLAAAMRGLCREFEEQQDVEINFESHGLPNPLSPDISLCFFRVLQEALDNSVKHSGVRHFEVRSWGTPNEVHLTVSDLGGGFDKATAKAGRGLGLISMEERLKIVHGSLSIESHLRARYYGPCFSAYRSSQHFGADGLATFASWLSCKLVNF